MFIPDLDKNKLIERLNYSMKKEDVVRLAESFSLLGVDPVEILNLTASSNDAACFHSAWVLENMLLPFPEALDYYLPNLIDSLPNTKNASARRHLVKLVAFGIKRIVTRKSSRVFERNFWTINLEPLEEACFKWFVNEDTKPAVKTHCMDILYLLSIKQRWIAEELPHIIENQMSYGSPGIRAKGKAVLKLLKALK